MPGTLTAIVLGLTCDLTPPYLLAPPLLACLSLARVLVWWLRVAGCGRCAMITKDGPLIGEQRDRCARRDKGQL